MLTIAANISRVSSALEPRQEKTLQAICAGGVAVILAAALGSAVLQRMAPGDVCIGAGGVDYNAMKNI